MSRVETSSGSEPLRPEYTAPEDLDRILEQLRRMREGGDATGAAPPATPPLADKIELPTPAPELPAAGHAGTARTESARTPTARIAGDPPPPEARSARVTTQPVSKGEAHGPTQPLAGRSLLRHLPEQARDKLTAFVAGKPEPTPRPPGDEAGAATRPAAPVPTTQPIGQSELKSAILASRQAFIAAGGYSFAINLLMLAGPLFMLQVYDRVIGSGSISTLVALSLLTAAAYGAIGLLELVRSRIIVRIGVELDRRVGDRVFQASLKRSIRTHGAAMPVLRELDALRQFIAGPGPITFFDAPWTPVYLAVVFMLHWSLGLAALVGTALLLAIAWASEVRSRGPLLEAGKAAARSLEIADSGQRNAEAIAAMGMATAFRNRWQAANAQSLAWQVLAADRLGSLSSLSKALRLLMQSMMLAIGAALAVGGMISAGSIVAATIIFGRALAPIEQAIVHWRGLGKAREAYDRLERLLAEHPREASRTELPAPKGHLEVANLRVAAPETRHIILNNISFQAEPGKMVAVIGPSASGKSTLARSLVGLWEPASGSIRLDGARLDQWSGEALGRHIGYLPQDAELFAGTVRDNIARFRADASDEDVVAAAKAAHAHDMITALPNGYNTELGAYGTYLSAGQRQRVGLSRALFGNPALVVLDEPNANLDRIGDEALAAAIDGMRTRGQAVILVSHRVQAIGKADYLLYLDRGVQRAFGPRADVIRYLQASMQGAPSPSAAPATAATDVVAAAAVTSDPTAGR